MHLGRFPPWIHWKSTGDCPRENTAQYRAISAFVSAATAGGRTDGANAVAAKAMHITVAKCFICFAHIIPFRAAHLPRYLPTCIFQPQMGKIQVKLGKWGCLRV